MTLPRRITLLGLGLLLSGCALLSRTGEGQDYFAPDQGREGPVRIEVQNEHFQDARIYANWGGLRQRIGTVTGGTTRTLEVEWRGTDLILEVDFIAGGGFAAHPVTVWPGQTLVLRIPPAGSSAAGVTPY